MTKRWISLLLIMALLGVGAFAQEQEAPIILMCFYRQVGWGNAARALYLDENGTIWKWNGEWTDYLSEADNLEFLANVQDAEPIKQLERTRVFELQSLIATCEAQDMEILPLYMNDYGAITYTAVRYDKDGGAELIPLALTGDDNRENPEENAHALYLSMTELGIAIDVDEFPPTPFPRKSLAAFCGYSEDIFKNASVCAIAEDCEEGRMEQEIDPAEAQKLIDWLSDLQVIGKQGSYSTTSGTIYQLISSEGDALAIFEFNSENNLVTNDGVYAVESIR